MLPSWHGATALAAALTTALLCAATATLTPAARGHDWYPSDCSAHHEAVR